MREPIPDRRYLRTPTFMALLAGLLALLGWFAFTASAESVDNLRGDIPTGDEVRAELDAIADRRVELVGDLVAAERSIAVIFEAREQLDSTQRRLTAEIEASTESLRLVGIRAFMSGGPVGELEFLSDVGDASELSWRNHLIRNHASSFTVAVQRLRFVRSQADDSVLENIDRAGELRHEIDMLTLSLDELGPVEEEARRLVPLAEAWDRAAVSIAEGSYGIAPADKWKALRLCESTHNYEAISPSGLYRGAYQFDIATWYAVGGVGDPIQAPPEEQDARARELYARRGDQPWPVCGRYLK
ncbi:MAG: hypothetical protein HOH36_07960 [Acidimicrobiaceae bacterium]|nr:hypothetical protein [Acidimicrobiaceae bacterium]MBT5850351.1 hypothetical protein [Acidimicrobiaceae bacterium]